MKITIDDFLKAVLFVSFAGVLYILFCKESEKEVPTEQFVSIDQTNEQDCVSACGADTKCTAASFDGSVCKVSQNFGELSNAYIKKDKNSNVFIGPDSMEYVPE